MGCDTCCPEPPCPAPSLECQQISQTKSKAAPCGFLSGGDYFSTKTVTYSYHPAMTMTGCGFPGGDSGPYTRSCDTTVTETKSLVGGTCTPTTSYTGSQSKSRTCAGATSTCSASRNATTGEWTFTFTPAEGDPETGSGDCSVTCGSGTTTYSGTVSAESTADLISRTIAALPAWPETWTGGCSSFRNLSPDESSFSLTRTKWRVAHSPTGTCYLKVWLRTRFVPEGGGSEIITPLTAYEWTATGNPCLPDLTKGPDHADNIIRSDETEEQEPADDGTTYVEIVKWSCQPSYTPPDDGSANGLPPFAP